MEGVQSGSCLKVRGVSPNRDVLGAFSPRLEREERREEWVGHVKKGQTRRRTKRAQTLHGYAKSSVYGMDPAKGRLLID